MNVNNVINTTVSDVTAVFLARRRNGALRRFCPTEFIVNTITMYITITIMLIIMFIITSD